MENKKNINVVAIIGFVFSILSIITFGFLSVVGLTLSIIGLIIAKKYIKNLKGLSITGIIISSLCFALFWGLVIFTINNGDLQIQNNNNSSFVSQNYDNLKEVTVIDFSTMNKEEIENWCNNNNVDCHFDNDYSDDVSEGNFIRQSITANTKVNEKTVILITYSLGHKKTDEEIAEEEKELFKTSCQWYSYEEVSRNPDNYKGKPAVFRGQVIQVLESSYSTKINMRVDVTQNEYGWWDDTIYVTYDLPAGSSRILEKDIITMYGTLDGLYSYTSILGSTITLPKLDVKYVE